MAYRQMFLNHLVHHRAQLGVYLRLNDTPLPATYGPSGRIIGWASNRLVANGKHGFPSEPPWDESKSACAFVGVLPGFMIVIQSVLFLVHFFLYQTWVHSAGPGTDSLVTRIVFVLLSISFVSASLLAFRYTNPLVRAFYRVAAIWLGLLTFLFAAGVGSWMVLPSRRSPAGT